MRPQLPALRALPASEWKNKRCRLVRVREAGEMARLEKGAALARGCAHDLAWISMEADSRSLRPALPKQVSRELGRRAKRGDRLLHVAQLPVHENFLCGRIELTDLL